MYLDKKAKLVLIQIIVYMLCFISLIIYIIILKPDFHIDISEQLVFIIRGQGVLTGLLPYRDFNNNAAPLSGYLWAPFVFLSNATGINFEYLIRLLFIFSIILSSLLLYKLEEKKGNSRAFLIALIYGLNPFFLYLTFIWGSDETLCPLLILLPLYFFENNKISLGTFFVVLGAGLKYFPILLVPAIWMYSKNLKQRIVQCAFFLILLISITLPFYLIAPEHFIEQFADPIGNVADQGLATIIYWFFGLDLLKYDFVFKMIFLFFLILTGFVMLFAKNWDYRVFILPFIVFILFYTKFQISYIVILFPFVAGDIFQNTVRKSTSVFVYLIAFFYGESANALIHQRFESTFLIIGCWFIIVLFYSILTFLFVLNLRTILKKCKT